MRGEPIVCSLDDAYRCFLATEMDLLVLGDYVLDKEDVGQSMNAGKREEHLAQFQLD